MCPSTCLQLLASLVEKLRLLLLLHVPLRDLSPPLRNRQVGGPAQHRRLGLGLDRLGGARAGGRPDTCQGI